MLLRMGVAVGWLKKYRPISTAALFSFNVAMADIVSSLLPFPTGVEESNPYARTAAHVFHLGRGLAVKGIEFVFWSILAVMFYESIKEFNHRLAKTVAALTFAIPPAFIMPAVINNFLLFMRWYQP